MRGKNFAGHEPRPVVVIGETEGWKLKVVDNGGLEGLEDIGEEHHWMKLGPLVRAIFLLGGEVRIIKLRARVPNIPKSNPGT